MAEPASGAAAGVAGWKLLGGAAGAMGIGAGLSAFVVMLMTRPRSDQEWKVGITSTVVASVGGGAAAIIKLGLLQDLRAITSDVELFFAVLGMIGLVFACGLPGWAVVRWAFRWMEKRRERDLAEVVAEVRQQIGGGNG